MKKTIYAICHRIRSNPDLHQVLIYFFLLIISPTVLGAQAQDCACLDQVNILLEDSCYSVLTVDQVTPGICANSDARVIVNDNNPMNGDTIDCAGLFTYGLFYGEEMICWGTVLAEDKTAPVPIDTILRKDTLECSLVDFVLNNPQTVDPNYQNGKYYLGEVLFEDNCGRRTSDCGCEVQREFSDVVFYFDCDTTLANGKTAMIKRRWTATDCNGYYSTAYQYFYFFRPSLDTLHLLKDVVIQTCEPEKAVIPSAYPYWIDCFGDTLYLNQVDCNYAPTLDSRPFEVCADGSKKVETILKVFDWCKGNSSTIDTFTVKVGDFAAPVFGGNAENVAGSVFDSLQQYVRTDSLLRVMRAGRMPTLSTGPMDCTAALDLDSLRLPKALGFTIIDCSAPSVSVELYRFGKVFQHGIPVGDSTWQQTNYPMINNVATGIPVGIYALAITANDRCYNTAKGIVFFKVKDEVSPVMKCDDEITVSLTSGDPKIAAVDAYARLDAVDVNEGSWDNCEMGNIRIRRSVEDLVFCAPAFIAKGYDTNGPDNNGPDGKIDEHDFFDENGNSIKDPWEYSWELKDGVWYTPWRNFTEFFCCDAGASITIELGGWDKARDPLTGMRMPNFNSCWLRTVIEDAAPPRLSPLPSQRIKCDDPLLAQLRGGILTQNDLSRVRTRFGEAISLGNDCGSTSIAEYLIDRRVHCNVGTIERIVKLSKTSTNKGTAVDSIVQTITVVGSHDYVVCFPADVSTDCQLTTEANLEVDYEEFGCDLIAVTHEDERFPVPQSPDVCYKIFRTYRVMNWCEYDGESLPVVVSRDWDGWNGCDAPKTSTQPAEYNINPLRPDGDDLPGDEGICVIVKRNFYDNNRDTVYYDRDKDPHNGIPDDPNTVEKEGYWWKVLSGSANPDSEGYYALGYRCTTTGVWANDSNDAPDQLNGDPQLDDDDYRYGSNGFWQYTQHIKVYNKTDSNLEIVGTDTFCAVSNVDCAANVDFILRASDACTSGTISGVQIFVDYFNDGLGLVDVSDQLTDSLFRGRYPIGQHRIVFSASSGCGSRVSKERIFEVVDCLAPTPVCIRGLTIDLQRGLGAVNGITNLLVDNFIASPIGDCSGQGPVTVPVGNGINRPIVTRYSINRIGTNPHPDSTVLKVDCADSGQLVPIEIHAWDEAGNHGFCETFVQIEDGLNACSTPVAQGTVAGAIQTEQSEFVESVEVQLSGPQSTIFQTRADGVFSFRNLQEGYDYTIIPEYEGDHQNGISTYDLILISKHILGVKLLDSPYKLIAADVNASGAISTLDLIQLRKLILNVDSKFPSNSSWRFIDADYLFPQRHNPWYEPFPEIKNINNLDGASYADFVAVKIGDVNGSARANQFSMTESRTVDGLLKIHAEEQFLSTGATAMIAFTADLRSIEGFQFTLEIDTDQLEFLEFREGLTSEQEVALFGEGDRLTASWIRPEAAQYQENELLFVVVARAKTDLQLSEALEINSSLTSAEAYGIRGEQLNLGLTFGSQIAEETIQLSQNYPNPFNQHTWIRFQLPGSQFIRLSIEDIAGRQVWSTEGYYERGGHQIQVSAEELPASGLYTYTLRGEGFVESRKMLHNK